MNLAIDIGNTSSKLGVFKKDRLRQLEAVAKLESKLIEDLCRSYDIRQIIYSSVAGENAVLNKISLDSGIEVYRLGPETVVPVKIEYSTPTTLGSDRLAGIVAAYNKFVNTNVLVIDAGTAVTYDVLTSSGIYKGGNISPGLSMRFRSLNNYTSMLPLVSPDNKYDIIATDTENAIRSGVQQGLIFEINEYIRTFENLYQGLKVIITGGDGEFLSGLISQEVEFCPDLVIEGLNHIVNYNNA